MGAHRRQSRADTELDFVSPQLAAAMSHPTRVHAMCLLIERTASPREIAEEIDEPLNNVTYHVNQLRELGCIELVADRAGGAAGASSSTSTGPRQRAYFDEDAWDGARPRRSASA